MNTAAKSFLLTELSTTFQLPAATNPNTAYPPEADGCNECNRGDETKPWPIYTVNYHGVECCAKCLTPMSAKRKARR